MSPLQLYKKINKHGFTVKALFLYGLEDYFKNQVLDYCKAFGNYVILEKPKEKELFLELLSQTFDTDKIIVVKAFDKYKGNLDKVVNFLKGTSFPIIFITSYEKYPFGGFYDYIKEIGWVVNCCKLEIESERYKLYVKDLFRKNSIRIPERGEDAILGEFGRRVGSNLYLVDNEIKKIGWFTDYLTMADLRALVSQHEEEDKYNFCDRLRNISTLKGFNSLNTDLRELLGFCLKYFETLYLLSCFQTYNSERVICEKAEISTYKFRKYKKALGGYGKQYLKILKMLYKIEEMSYRGIDLKILFDRFLMGCYLENYEINGVQMRGGVLA